MQLINSLLQKISKISKIISVKESLLNIEISKLNSIKRDLEEISNNLNQYQSNYFNAIDDLNNKRKINPHKLDLFEDGVVFFKEKLQETMLKKIKWDEKEKIQLEIVVQFKTYIKSLESLKDKYIEKQTNYLIIKEQEELDELAISSIKFREFSRE